MKKLLYFALATLSLVFASCSVNKNSVHAGYLRSDKLETGQQLTIQPSNHEKLTTIDIPVWGVISQTNFSDIQVNAPKYEDQGFKNSAVKPIHASNLVKKAGKKLVAITKLPEAIASVNQIMKMPTHLTSSKRSQLSDTVSLILWIISLLAAVLFFFLVNVFGEVTTLGVLFNILAVLALIAFIVFFLMWITHLYKEKHHMM